MREEADQTVDPPLCAFLILFSYIILSACRRICSTSWWGGWQRRTPTLTPRKGQGAPSSHRGHSLNFLGNRAIVDGGEFIASKPVDLAPIPQNTGTDSGEILQIKITHHMSVLIVDGLKAIQIHKKDGESLIRIQKPLEVIPQLFAVAKAG